MAREREKEMDHDQRAAATPEEVRDAWQADLDHEIADAAPDSGAEAQVLRALHSEPIPIIDTPVDETWIWSDLHLADRSVLLAWDRPFRWIEQMNHHLLREWRRRVRPGHTIICLGDVAHPDAWRDRRLTLDVRNCPGRRVLILGNHDHNRHALRDAGFGVQHAAALYATDPPLALTHMLLRRVPPTAVNVRGHLHRADGPSRRHVNVSVERTDYAPIGLSWILKLCRRQTAA